MGYTHGDIRLGGRGAEVHVERLAHIHLKIYTLEAGTHLGMHTCMPDIHLEIYAWRAAIHMGYSQGGGRIYTWR